MCNFPSSIVSNLTVLSVRSDNTAILINVGACTLLVLKTIFLLEGTAATFKPKNEIGLEYDQLPTHAKASEQLSFMLSDAYSKAQLALKSSFIKTDTSLDCTIIVDNLFL